MFISTIFFLIVKIGVKLLPHIPTMEIVFFRCIISFFISFLILKNQGIYILGNNKFLLLMRGVFGTIGLYFYFLIIQNIPLATASIIIYITPIFTSIIGVFVLKEKINLLQSLCIFFAFLGILLIQGFDHRVTIDYLVLGLVGSFCAGCAYNIIRYLRDKEHSLVLVIYFPMIAFPIAWTQNGEEITRAILRGIYRKKGNTFKLYTLDNLSNGKFILATGELDMVKKTLNFKASYVE